MPTEKTKLKRVHKFKDAWRWPEDVERFIRNKCEGKTLHVCAGNSDLGDVTVDADPEREPDIVASMYDLPFDECSFETVLCDPPWKEVDIFQRHSLFYELVKLAKPQGKIIHNATWVPESDQCELIGEYRRQDISFGNASIISVFERFPDQQTIDGWDE